MDSCVGCNIPIEPSQEEEHEQERNESDRNILDNIGYWSAGSMDVYA
ncbi:hypothetical protein GW923_03840 [Candidatus Pacearchaeota archaeon]|nr:hypothetical protein [Candidatus Pacearchaeota archaeon]